MRSRAHGVEHDVVQLKAVVLPAWHIDPHDTGRRQLGVVSPVRRDDQGDLVGAGGNIHSVEGAVVDGYAELYCG